VSYTFGYTALDKQPMAKTSNFDKSHMAKPNVRILIVQMCHAAQ